MNILGLDGTEVQTLVWRGVAGYILKEEITEKVVEAILPVAEGKTWFSQRVIANLLLSKSTPKITLTRREHDILKLVIDEKSDENIGQTLNISARMVRHYLKDIYSKLGAVPGAAVRAVRLKLIKE